MNLLLRWLLNALALAVAAWAVPGIEVEGTGPLLLAAAVIGLVNSVLKPVLVLLTLPLTVLTLGIFYLVLNGLLFYLAAGLTPGFSLSGFWPAVFGALVMSLAATTLHGLAADPEDEDD